MKRNVFWGACCALFCAVGLLLCGCERVDVNEDENENQNLVKKTKNVKFKVSGLTVETEAFSSSGVEGIGVHDEVGSGEQYGKGVSRASLTEAGMTDLFVVDTDGSVLVHQLSTDADWGAPNIALTYGRHELAFVATKGTNAVVSDKVFSMDKVKDTFVKYVTLDVSQTTLQQNVALERAVWGLKVSVEDVTQKAITKVRVTVGSRGVGLNVPGLTGVMSSDNVTEIGVPDGTFQTAGVALTLYGFMGTLGTEYKTDVKVEFLSAQGTAVFSKSLTDVPLLNNRVTNLKGSWFSSSSSANVSVNMSWGNEKTVSI